ncbi:MAG: hypothetical protein KBD24_01730, partial [Candidatus Pacebacteria bacterium]|nr:hypothetical protein [Candidatus Paceibacterota bacterium]
MHTLFRTTLALFLAISIVMPSVYVGLETPRTQAYDFSGAGGGAIVASAVCNLGGWVNNFLSSAMPWLFPPVTATNINADKFHNITTAGAVIPPAESPTPLIVLDEALWGLEASFTTHVPTADTWMQLQNYEHSQQQAMIQRNTQAISESGNNVSINTGSITWKDCVLDPLVNLLKEMIIDAVTQSIIDWIKGGFKDTPQFLEDPEEFFRDLGMSVVSQYLFDRGLNDLLCEPFRIEIIFSVAFNYSQSNHREGGRLSCSLEDIFPGVNASIDINGDGTINENEQYLDSSTAYKEIVENGNIDFPGGGFPALTGMI